MIIYKHLELAYAWLVILTRTKRQSILLEHALNRWDWPFDFFGKYYESLPNYIGGLQKEKGENFPNKFDWFRKPMEYLKSKSTYYEKLKYHNVEYLKNKTEEEFEIWYKEEEFDTIAWIKEAAKLK